MAFAPGPQLFDDPIARTRMAWVRTVLAVVVLGFLLVRGVLVLDAPRYLAYLAAASVAVIIAAALRRFAVLGRGDKRGPLTTGRSSVVVRSMVVAGVFALLGIGMALTLSILFS